MKVREYEEKDKWGDVAPLVGAWIESIKGKISYWYVSVAPLVGAWIERTPHKLIKLCLPSLLL